LLPSERRNDLLGSRLVGSLGRKASRSGPAKEPVDGFVAISVVPFVVPSVCHNSLLPPVPTAPKKKVLPEGAVAPPSTKLTPGGVRLVVSASVPSLTHN